MSRIYPSHAQPRRVRSVGWADAVAASEIQRPSWSLTGDEQKVRAFRFPSLTGEVDPLFEESLETEPETEPEAAETSPEAASDELADVEQEPEPDPEAVAEAVRQQGWEEGYAQGEQAARTHFSSLAGAVTSLQSLGAGLHVQLGDAAIRLACRIASHVVEAEVAAAPELLVESVLRAVKSLDGAQSVTIRMHPADIALLEAAGAATGAAEFGVLNLAFEADSSLQRGGYVVDSNAGGIDGELGRRLAVIEEQLLALDDEGLLEELFPSPAGVASDPDPDLPADSEQGDEMTVDPETTLDSEPGSGEEADD